MELFKILKNKKFIAAVILLLLLNCAFFYITQQKNLKEFDINIDAYSRVFSENSYIFSEDSAKETVIEKNNEIQIIKSFADAEKLKAENAEEYEYYAQEEAALITEYHSLYREYKEGKYLDEELSALTDFYSHFAYQAEYQNDYQSYIDSIAENSRELTSKKLFSDKTSFSYKSIQKTAHDFSKNRDLQLKLVNDLPVSAVLNYNIGDFVLILLCVFIVIIFTAEKNVNILINTCRNGRMMLKIKQLPVLLLFSLLISSLVYISEILIALKIYNAPLDFSAPIQSADMFSDCVLHISILQLIVANIIFKAAIAVMTASLMWLLISLNSNIILDCGIAGAIAAAELLLYKNISEQSSLSFLKTFNIFSLFDYSSITEYSLISVFSVPVRAEKIIWVIVLFITVCVAVLVIISSKRNYPVKTPSNVFAFLQRILKYLNTVYLKIQNTVYAGRYETFKLMHIGKGILVVAVFFLIIGFSFNTNTLVFSPEETFLNDYYEEYGGELSSAVYDSIDKMQSESQAVEKEFNVKSKQFAEDEISFEEYELALAKNDAYDTQRKAVEVLREQVGRIEVLKEKGIEPVLINEAGYNSLFSTLSNQSELLFLLCAVIIIFSSAFSIEKTSNMLSLNHCAKNGRQNLYFKKILCVIPKTFTLTLISYLSMILQINYFYKIEYLSADIHNLQILQNVDIEVSILEYLIINFLFEFLFVTAAAFITVSLSSFMPQMAVIIISAGLFVLPGALNMVDIDFAKEVSASFLFNFNSFVLDKGLSAYSFAVHFILIIVCAAMLYMSNRRWCLTKDR